MNRSFFMPGCDYHELGFGLELWKGAYASVRPCELGLTWNLDSANAAFLTSQDLLELAKSHYNPNSCDELRTKILNDRDRDGTIGVSFLETYKGREIKTATGGYRKRIQGFGPDASYKFEWTENGKTEKISVKDYLKQKYKINLK